LKKNVKKRKKILGVMFDLKKKEKVVRGGIKKGKKKRMDCADRWWWGGGAGPSPGLKWVCKG